MLFGLLLALVCARSHRRRRHTNEDEAWHQIKFLKPEKKPPGSALRQRAEQYLKDQTRKYMRRELKRATRQHQNDVLTMALYKALDLPLTLRGTEYTLYEQMMKHAAQNNTK